MSELIDNRAQRVRTLKGIIQRLHAGEGQDAVRASLKELVCQTDYSEVMAMEQELIADGMPVEEILGMCDLHSQVTREVLVQLAPAPLPPPAELRTRLPIDREGGMGVAGRSRTLERSIPNRRRRRP